MSTCFVIQRKRKHADTHTHVSVGTHRRVSALESSSNDQTSKKWRSVRRPLGRNIRSRRNKKLFHSPRPARMGVKTTRSFQVTLSRTAVQNLPHLTEPAFDRVVELSRRLSCHTKRETLWDTSREKRGTGVRHCRRFSPAPSFYAPHITPLPDSFRLGVLNFLHPPCCSLSNPLSSFAQDAHSWGNERDFCADSLTPTVKAALSSMRITNGLLRFSSRCSRTLLRGSPVTA